MLPTPSAGHFSLAIQIFTQKHQVQTQGQGDFVDLTSSISSGLLETKLTEGQATIFVVGSTAGITTLEYEPGLIKDMNAVYERLAAREDDYFHHLTWGDDNGSSHVRAALQGPSITIPFLNQKLLLGQWQQVVLAEFDTQPRTRTIIAQFIGVRTQAPSPPNQKKSVNSYEANFTV